MLHSGENSETLSKTITTNVIDSTMRTSTEHVETHQCPLNILSEVLQQQVYNSTSFVSQNIIETLQPLLEKDYPTPAMCDFFSQYCYDSQHSKIVLEIFTPAIERILKYNTDFIKYYRMRILVQKYLFALYSQKDGDCLVDSFIKRIHGETIVCPFLRVLSNLISVCLAGITNYCQNQNNFCLEDKNNCSVHDDTNERQLLCFTKILQTISTFEDWRRHLGLVLQPIPFSSLVLKNTNCMKTLKIIVKNLVNDRRCEVHRTILSIRAYKDGWFEIFCLNDINCDDNDDTFLLMLHRLLSCCCRKKYFLSGINKLIPSLILFASRENQSAIDTLCAMIELNAVESDDYRLKIISTLKSTPIGLKIYNELCENQRVLNQLQQHGGPRELILPSHSTDSDLEKLLSKGPCGDLAYLILEFTNVTDACAEQLIKLRALKHLNLRATRFGDHGLELLAEHLNQLEILNLCETRVTDNGLSYLANMKTLKELNISSTNVSWLAIEILKGQLPLLTKCDMRYTNAW